MSAAFHYVATSAKPSAVSHAVVGHFTAPDELNLLIAKSTRLELHTITPDGLQPLYDVPVYGRIAAMCLVRLAGDARDTLVFTTERFQMVALQFDERTKQLRTVATGDLRDRIGRQVERGQIMTVDPLGRAVAMQFYDGAVKIVPIERGFREKAFNVRLDHPYVRDLCFVAPFGGATNPAAAAAGGAGAASSSSSSSSSATSSASAPVLAVLYDDETGSGRVLLQCYELDAKHAELRRVFTRPIQLPDTEAAVLQAVPASAGGGLLVFGRTSIVHVNLPVAAAAVPVPAARAVTGAAAGSSTTTTTRGITLLPVSPMIPRVVSCVDEATGDSFLVGDALGGLHLLRIRTLGGAGSTGGGGDDDDDDDAVLAAPAATTTASGTGARSSSGGGAGGVSVAGGGVSLRIDRLGATCVPSAVAYLTDGYAFVGSRHGDGQLLRLHPIGPDGDIVSPGAPAAADASAAGALGSGGFGNKFDVLSTFSCLGPIVDMVALERDKTQGQATIVTASGSGRDGSLRVVRNGVGVEEQAVVELPGITGLWALQGPPPAAAAGGSDIGTGSGVVEGTGRDKYLVQSFAGETRILAIEGSEMEELDAEGAPGFALGGPTLHCATMAGGLLLQATPTEVRLIHPGNGCALASSWTPASAAASSGAVAGLPALAGKRITLASAHGSQLLVALSGGVVLYLEVDTGSATLALRGFAVLPHEVSCLDVSPLTLAAAGGSGAAGSERALFAAVGLWTDVTARVLRLPAAGAAGVSPLAEVAKEALGGDIQPRSILLASLEGVHYLLVAMGDGRLLHFHATPASSAAAGGAAAAGSRMVTDDDDVIGSSSASSTSAVPSTLRLSGRKSLALGTQPITLSFFTSKGVPTVFASCDRPSVLFSRGRKLLLSTVNQPHVTYMAPFSSESFPDCIALATEAGLSIGTIESIQKLHTRCVPLGEQPRRLAWHRDSGSVVVAVEAVTPAVMQSAVAAPVAGAASSSSSSSAAAAAPPLEPNVLLESCFVRLLSETSFSRLASFPLDPHELVLSLATVRLPKLGSGSAAAGAAASSSSAGVSGGEEADEELILVGTAYVEEDEEEPSLGRLLVLRPVPVASGMGIGAEEGSETALQLVAHREVRGGVFSMAPVGGLGSGRIACGINSVVQVLQWRTATDADATAAAAIAAKKQKRAAAAGGAAASSAGSSVAALAAGTPALVPECSFAGNTLALYMDTGKAAGGGDFIIVGDLMKSIGLLRYSTTERCLEEVAVDPSHNWMTAVAMVDDGCFIGAEHHYNLFTSVRKVVGTATATRSYLECTGTFHLGEMVNKFVPGSLVMVTGTGEESASAPSSSSSSATRSASAGAALGADDDDDDALPAGAAAKRRRTGEGVGDAVAGGDASSSSSSASAAGGLAPRPRFIYATVDGSIGAVIAVPKPLYRYLATLQAAINATIHGIGGLSHTYWRTWHSDRKTPNTVPIGGTLAGPAGYIDGDLVELVLDLERPALERVVAAMNKLRGERVCGEDGLEAALHPDGSAKRGAEHDATVEEVLRVVEEMSRLH